MGHSKEQSYLFVAFLGVVRLIKEAMILSNNWPNQSLHLTANSVAVLQSFVPYQSLVVM